MAARKEQAYARQGREVILPLVAEAILEDCVVTRGLTYPEFVMLPVDEEGSEAAKAVKIGCPRELEPEAGGRSRCFCGLESAEEPV